MRSGADLRRQLLGRRAFVAGQRAAGGPVRGYGADVLEHGHHALEHVVVCDHRADCVRGRHECHQFHGRHQRNHGGIRHCGAGAAAAGEPCRGVRGRELSGGGHHRRAGVLYLQFPPQGQGQVFRR